MAPTYRAMTSAEREAALALRPGVVTYQVASFDKRFARSLAEQVNAGEPRITERQSGHLRAALFRYRRQVPNWREMLDDLDREAAHGRVEWGGRGPAGRG